MALVFYPHEEDLASSALQEKLEILLESAERYKAAVLDTGAKRMSDGIVQKVALPREITLSFNWEEIARTLREIRDLPEATSNNKATKSKYFLRLSEVYEVLRGAKMPKLEAVRLALVNEANQLRGQVA